MNCHTHDRILNLKYPNKSSQFKMTGFHFLRYFAVTLIN